MRKSIEKKVFDLLKQGNHQAFEKIFITYFNNVKFFIQSFIKSNSEAEGLAQDIFLKIWENHSQIDTEKSFDSYLYTIARNTVFNYLKHKTVENSYSEYVHFSRSEFVDDPEKILYAKEIELLIEMKVEQMPQRRREIYKLSRFEGLSNDDIATNLGISKKTVENQLSLALNELRKLIIIFLTFFSLN